MVFGFRDFLFSKAGVKVFYHDLVSNYRLTVEVLVINDKHSYTKFEKQLLPDFRKKITQSEDCVDLVNHFSYEMMLLMDNIFNHNAENRMRFDPEDILFDPMLDGHVRYSEKIMGFMKFRDAMEGSDLGNIISRFAETTKDRYIHLRKHPEKTRSKIRWRM